MLVWVLAFLALAALCGLAYLWSIAPVGTGYKAKVLGSALYVSGRELDLKSADEVSADSYGILPWFFPARADREAKTVTVTCLGLRPRTAVYRPGLGVTLAGDGPLPRATVPGVPEPEVFPPPQESPALRRFIDEAFAEPDPKRLRRTRAVVVVKDGAVVGERYAPGFSASTRLSGWSMTKSVVGALVGVLAGEGKLSLKDKGLFPEWRDGRGEITLEDLLRMRSGLEFSEVYSNLYSDVNQMLFVSPDAAAVAAARPLAQPPGTHWQYSSGTTNLLSRIIRRAVGEEHYPTFPRRALFTPLGMKSALMEPDASGTFVGSSFMFATARDWARFGELFLQDGVWEGRRLLPEGWVGFSASATPQSPQGRYGAHWWLKLPRDLGGETEAAKSIPPDAFFALGHEGQTLTVIPSRRLIAVRLGLSIYTDAWDQARFISGLLETL